MTQIEITEGGFVVDAELLADAFRVEPASVRRLMQSGTITSRCEKGVDADEGRWRLAFFHDGRTLRLTIDSTGRILSNVRFAVTGRSSRQETG